MKKYFLAAMFLLAIALSASCTKTAEVYNFPITREAVEHVVKSKNLTWNITDEQTDEFHSSFIMKNDGDEAGRSDIGITAIIESIGNDDERYISAQIIYPNNYSYAQIQEEQVENLPLLIDLATELYGISSSSKLIFNEFTKHSDKDADYENSGVLWEYETKGTHVLLRISSLNKNVVHRKCSVSIMNDTSYGKYEASKNEIMSKYEFIDSVASVSSEKVKQINNSMNYYDIINLLGQSKNIGSGLTILQYVVDGEYSLLLPFIKPLSQPAGFVGEELLKQLQPALN